MKKSIIIIVLILLTVTIVFGQNKRPVTLNPRSGYVNIDELNFGYGLGDINNDYSKNFYGLTTTHGYQLNIYGLGVNSSLACGIGAGIFLYNGGPELLLPLYGDIRFTMKRKKVSPYFFTRGGFLISTKDLNRQTRLFANGGGGVYFRIDDHLSVNLGPGLFIQMGAVSRDAFINLNVGIVFKPL
jgi:hypothetical protein